MSMPTTKHRPAHSRSGAWIRPVLLVAASGLLSIPAAAQDDRAAGLFTTAGQLPLVEQAVDVRVIGNEATITLEQSFANDASDVRQADYRLMLPPGARISGFGFFSDGELHLASLKDKKRAERDHRAAAAAGRETGLAKSDLVSHAFSVFPIRPHERKRVQVQIHMPVTVADGKASLRLPLDLFLGQSTGSKTKTTITPVRTALTARIDGDAEIQEVSFEGARTSTVVLRKNKQAVVVGDAAQPVALVWRERTEGLTARGYTVALPGGRRGIEVALNFALRGHDDTAKILLLVDGSASMRASLPALQRALLRAQERSGDRVAVFAVGEAGHIEIENTGAVAKMARAVIDGRAGHRASAADFQRARSALKCSREQNRCVTITDGQLKNLAADLKRETKTLVLAAPDDVERDAVNLGPASKANVFVSGVQAKADLVTLIDELTLPTLNVALMTAGRDALTFLGRPRMVVAEGGQRRYFAELSNGKRKKRPRSVVIDASVGGKPVAVTAALQVLASKSERGLALRKSVYQRQLETMVRNHEKKPSEATRKRIVELSLRESIPTRLTAWHVDRPVVSRTGSGRGLAGKALGGSAVTYLKKTRIDFSDETVEGDLAKPSGSYLRSRSKLSGSARGESFGAGGLGVRGTGSGGGGGSATGLVGIGTSGVGRGAGGRGTIDLGGRGKGMARIRAGRVIFKGSLDKGEIARVIKRSRSRMRYCYEKALTRNPTLGGKVVVRFAVNKDGRVSDAKIESATLKDDQVHKCLTKTFSRLRFPKPAGGGIVKVSYPLIFTTPRTTPTAPAPAIPEALTSSEINNAVVAHRDSFAACKDLGRLEKAGVFSADIKVKPSGEVKMVSVKENTLPNAEVAVCVKDAVTKLRFNEADADVRTGIVTIRMRADK